MKVFVDSTSVNKKTLTLPSGVRLHSEELELIVYDAILSFAAKEAEKGASDG